VAKHAEPSLVEVKVEEWRIEAAKTAAPIHVAVKIKGRRIIEGAKRTTTATRTNEELVRYLLFLVQFQGCGVHAIPQPGWGRTIFEQVAEMGAAVTTGDLGSHHAVRAVGLSGHVARFYRLVEAGPAGAGLIFCF